MSELITIVCSNWSKRQYFNTSFLKCLKIVHINFSLGLFLFSGFVPNFLFISNAKLKSILFTLLNFLFWLGCFIKYLLVQLFRKFLSASWRTSQGIRGYRSSVIVFFASNRASISIYDPSHAIEPIFKPTCIHHIQSFICTLMFWVYLIWSCL